MRYALFAIAIISVSSIAGTAFTEEPQSDFARLQGTWKGTNPDGATLNLAVAGNTFKTAVKVKSSARGRGGSYTMEQDFTIDEITSPKEIDFHTIDDNGEEKIIMAIYKLKADKFTLCMDRTGKKRPTKFDGTSDGGTMIVYNRYPQNDRSTQAEPVGKVTAKAIIR